MLTFKTQFPINSQKNIKDIVDVGRVWLSGSPHSTLSSIMRSAGVIENEWSSHSQNESIYFYIFEEENIASFRHENLDENGVRWVTEVASYKNNQGFWVSVQLSADSELPVERVDQGKRPYILKNIMRSIGGGMDGPLLVSDNPHYLGEDEIELAANIITANAGCVMPIVYVSATNSNDPHINVEQMSHWLSGMAHVVVEPSRSFSFQLMGEVFGENAYGGAVAIYWPDGIGKWLFLPKDEYSDAKAMQIAISRKVRSSLLSQRTKKECRWGYSQELNSKRKLFELKSSGSDDVEDYMAVFDEEIKAKDEEIMRLESEVNRLRYGTQYSGSSDAKSKNTISLNGNENDLYQAERLSIIMDALSRELDSSDAHSRRWDVISDLIDRNSQEGERDEILERLKSLLRSYNSMSSTVRQELESLGFAISEEGKHYKLIFRQDSRYSFTLAKTGSDYRGGLNAFSDIRRRMF